MKVWCAPALAGLVLASVCAIAQAQTPSKAQQDAIRSNCRSDFMRNCSSVTPGGREALDCLMQNKAKVSGGCQGALNAIAPAPAAAKPEPKPEPKAAAPKPEPAPAAVTPTPPTAPTASAPVEPAPKRAKAKPAPKTVATPARPAPPAVPPPAAPAALAPAAEPQATQPRLGEAILIRRFCTTDFRVLCKGVPLGQGRAVQCLASNAAALSPGCREMMIKTGELRP